MKRLRTCLFVNEILFFTILPISFKTKAKHAVCREGKESRQIETRHYN